MHVFEALVISYGHNLNIWTTVRYPRPGWQVKWLIYTTFNITPLPFSLLFYPSSCPFTPPPFSFPYSLFTALLLSLQACLVWGWLNEKLPSFPWWISSLSLHLNFLHPNISSLITIYKYGYPKMDSYEEYNHRGISSDP